MLDSFADQLNVFIKKSQFYLIPWLWFLAILWAINIFNWMIGSRLNRIFGLYPRRFPGLIGIPFSPILHQNFGHLFFNTIPLFVLGLVILTQGLTIFSHVTIIVILLGGLLVWLIGRKANHIGASGVVSGYFGFILVAAYLNPSFTTVLLAIMALYYFGSIFLGIFPQEEKISWESHLCGFLSGIVSAYLHYAKKAQFFLQW